MNRARTSRELKAFVIKLELSTWIRQTALRKAAAK
jgi:hypothetical protein